MTKPIEWRLPDKTETKTIPGKSVRLGVYVPAEGYLLRWATPSDLASALAAMGEGERAEVLAQIPEAMTTLERRYLLERNEATARAEKAERERDEAREARDRSTRLRDAMMPDTRAALDAEQYEDALTAARRVVAEQDELRGKIEALETELFSARLTLGSLQHEEDVTRRQLKAEPCESIPGALRRVVQGLERERDDLRVKNDGLRDCLAERKTICEDAIKRAVAAETAAAQREPREYPLERGSRFVNDTVQDGCGTVTTIVGGKGGELVIQWGTGYPFLADVLALAHRRGPL